MFPLISEKAVEEAVRNCEQLKRREQEEDNVTFGGTGGSNVLKHWRWWRRRGRLWSRRELCTIVLQTRSVRAEDTQYLCTNALSHALTEQLKRDFT